jgi:hypothetical protein
MSRRGRAFQNSSEIHPRRGKEEDLGSSRIYNVPKIPNSLGYLLYFGRFIFLERPYPKV